MTDARHQKEHIQLAIDRARDGVSSHIDELDQRLRAKLDVRSMASEHASKLVAGAAVVGFLAGFGFPKPLRRMVAIGIPLALVAAKLRGGRTGGDEGGWDPAV